MSLGSIIGGVAGGVIGFFVGGPTGAYYGAALGFGIGMVVDPITPDIPSVGDPNPQEQVMNGEIGGSIADLCGTGKVTGKLLFFGGERNTKVYAESSGGGKGGSPEPQQQLTGYKYYMSWGVGLISCPDNPVNVLYAIYKNDDKEPVWPSAADDDDDWEGLPLPVSGGQETIVIEGIGSLVFSFGTDDQMPIIAVEELITDSTLNTPYRYMCWAFFDDCYIGEYNRTPTYRFVLKKIPEIAAMPGNASIQIYDCNPAHALYYILNVLSGLDVSWLDAASFNNVAITLFNERRGVSLLLEQQQGALNYIEQINGHIDNIIRYGSDGKFHLKLIRDDYIDGDLLLVDESVMLENPTFNRGSWIDTVNETKIQYNEIINVERPGLFNIYGLTASGSTIYGVVFDGANLGEVGYYESPSADINGLVVENDKLLTVAGNGPTASLREVSMTATNGLLPLLNEEFPFNNYDIIAAGSGALVIDDDTGVIYYSEAGTRILKITSSLVKELRCFSGTVTPGTDGNLYYPNASNSDWSADKRPITGFAYSGFYTLIDDNINDGVTTAWGIGTLYTNVGAGPHHPIIHKGDLYQVLSSSPTSYVRRYDYDDLALLDSIGSTITHPIAGLGSNIFTLEGGLSSTLRKYTDIPLSSVSTLPLPIGRATELIEAGGNLIAYNRSYLGDSAIYKIDPDSMSIIDSTTNPGTVGWQKMAKMDDTFIAMGSSAKVGVFNVETMEMVDEIAFPTDGGYSTRDLVVRSL